MRNLALFIFVAVVGLGMGVGFAWWLRSEPPQPGIEGATTGDMRPGFRHADLNGQWVDAEAFDGRVLLVNFWATWCAPCRREMPVLQEASARHGEHLAIVGIAMDEPLPVAEFVAELGIDYPILVGTMDVLSTQKAWGNRSGALPYTVLVDRTGVIRWQHLGEVEAAELERRLEPVL